MTLLLRTVILLAAVVGTEGVVFLVLVAVGFLYASRSRWLARLSIGALAVAALIAVLYGLTWADSDHWPIAISFFVLAFAMPLVATVASHTISARRAS